MPNPAKRAASVTSEIDFPPGSVLGFLAARSQLDFEVDFYQRVLEKLPHFAEILRVQAGNLTIKGRLDDGLRVDKQLVEIEVDAGHRPVGLMGKGIPYIERPVIATPIDQHDGEEELVCLIEPVENFIAGDGD